MSSRELERVEVMGRVGSGDLKLSDAAVMLELSYRQTKRVWRQYREVGRKGLKHGNAGRPSNRSKPARFRRRVLNLIKEKYSGSEAERFGPTLAAEHLAEEDGMVLDHDTLRLWMLQDGLWSRQRKRKKHLRGEFLPRPIPSPSCRQPFPYPINGRMPVTREQFWGEL
jgi:hypothetical protein